MVKGTAVVTAGQLTDKVGQAPPPGTDLAEAAGPRTRASTLATMVDMRQTASTVSVVAAQRTNHPPIPVFTIMKNTSALAVFMALSYTFSFSLVAVGMMAGRINDGKDNVGAAGLITTYLNMVVMIALAGFYCISAYVSQKWGNLKDLNESPIPSDTGLATTYAEEIRAVKADISRIFKNSALIGIIPAAFAVSLLLLSESILKGLGQPAEVSELAGSFLSVYALAVVFLFLRMFLDQILFAFKEQKAAMIIGLVSFFIGVGCAYSLCFNAELGLPGIALGFSIEALLTSLGFGAYILWGKAFKEFNFFNNFSFGKEDIAQIKTLVQGGWPIALTIGLEVIAMQAMTSIAGRMGSDPLDAYTIASRPYFTALPLIIAFGQTIRQEVGRLFGQKDFLNMSRTAYYGLLSTVLLIAPFCIAVAAYPDLLIAIMTGGEANQQVRDMVAVMAPIFALGVVLPETVRYNWLNVITGLAFYEKNMRGQVLPVIFSTGSLWLAVIMTWLLSTFTDVGIYSVPACLAAGITLGAALLGPQWLTKARSYEQKSHEVRSPVHGANTSINVEATETTPLIGPAPEPVAAGDGAPDPNYRLDHYPSSV